MSEISAALDQIDRLLGQLAVAMQDQAWHIYPTLAFMILLTALLFPPKDDPDQI